MAGKKHHEYLSTESSLDFPMESMMGMIGPFSPDEYAIIFLYGPAPIAVITTLLYFPIHKFFHLPGFIFATVFAVTLIGGFCVTPMILLSLKRNKPKSWLFDLAHRRRIKVLLYMFRGNHHFLRPKGDEIFASRRQCIVSKWTRPTQACFVPTIPRHLSLGLPSIRIYLPKTRNWSRSITAEFKGDGYCLMHHSRRPNARRIPDSMRNAIIAKDENGHAAMQDFVRAITPWVQPSTREEAARFASNAAEPAEVA